MNFEHEGLVRNISKKFMHQCHNTEEYEDLLQLTRMILIEVSRDYNPEKTKFTTFCYTAVKNKLINHFETASIRDYNRMVVFEPNIFKYIHSNLSYPREEFMDLSNSLAKLTKKEQKMLSMKAQGYLNKEIGKKYKISGERVRQILENIKEKLK